MTPRWRRAPGASSTAPTGARSSGRATRPRCASPSATGPACPTGSSSSCPPRRASRVTVRSGDAAATVVVGTERAWHRRCPRPARPSTWSRTSGSVIIEGGYGADRGFLEPDAGQYDAPAEVFAWCGGSVLLRPAYLADVGLFDERLLPLLRGHRPVVARPQPGLALPLRARRPGPPRPRGVDRRGVARLPALRRAQPAPDAGQERPAPPGGERRVALSPDDPVVHPAGHRGPGRGQAPAPAHHRVAAGRSRSSASCGCCRGHWWRAAASAGRPRSVTPSWPPGRFAGERPTVKVAVYDRYWSTGGRRRAVRGGHRGRVGRRSRRAPARPRRRRPRVARGATAPRPLGGGRRRARRRPRA